MALARIYSSKLYITSSRKDNIKAAIASPLNVELVQQLSDYLDDDAKEILDRATSDLPDTDQMDTDEGIPVTVGDSSVPVSDGSSHSDPGFSGDAIADFGEDELADIPMPDDTEGASESTPTEVEESTKVAGKAVTANTCIATIEDVTSESPIIQGSLNSREDTKGVSRIMVKDTELWIYYADEINLNDKMIDVIEALNGMGYGYLSFSRLARSNNAIVFDVLADTVEPVKSIVDLEES